MQTANSLFFDPKAPPRNPGVRSRTAGLKLWIYDLRTIKHFTLKENLLKRNDLDDFVSCYFDGKRGSQSRGYSGNRHNRKEPERFKSYTYDELTKRNP